MGLHAYATGGINVYDIGMISKSSMDNRPWGGGGWPKGGNWGGVRGRDNAAICASALSRLSGQ